VESDERQQHQQADIDIKVGKLQEDARSLFFQVQTLQNEKSAQASQIQQVEGRNRLVEGRNQRLVSLIESRDASSEHMGREANKKDAALMRGEAQADRISFAFARNRLLTKAERIAFMFARHRLLTKLTQRWREHSIDRSVRLQAVHTLFTKVNQHWQNKFYKNHLLAWKFIWGRSKNTEAELMKKTKRSLLKSAFDEWVLEVRSEAREAHVET
ncbi:hypothetical protein T484DRAFT_1764414, partial [Baffinella frigidus]